MSGGVDSAVAAARAAEAGHEVTGVHLALSANPKSYRTGARGCCTLEDARDARRAADVIGIPFYVWDMAERFDTRWLAVDYEAGDVMLHSPYMIHASTLNEDSQNRIRLSTDIRYQNVMDEIDVRWNNHWSLGDML